jgi:O-antigen biosynthesis protein WbqV
MGQPVKIVELAERLIRLAGYEPGKDVQIVFSGMRDGERLNEVLFAPHEPMAEIGIPGVVAARAERPTLATMQNWLAMLDTALQADSRDAALRVFREAVPDFCGKAA